MNPTANMGWGQGQGGCGPNSQLSVVATVWGVTTSTQSAPMGSYSQMGNSYSSGSGGGNNAYAPAGQMAMTKGSYGTGGGTGRHMGTGYAGGYVQHVSAGIY